MVLAAAAAATDTMDHSTKYSLDFSSSTMQYPFDSTNSSDPINCMTGSTATPFCTTDLFADKRTVPMTTTTTAETTLSPTSSVSAAAGLACLAAVSSYARDVAAAATPCRMESMLVDERKCLMAMSSVPSYSHPLFATTTPSSSKVGSAGMASRPMVITSSTPVIPVHDTEERRFNVRWDDNEDERLKHAIELEGHAWALIATKHFGNTRNKHQCKSRWSKVRCRQGPWCQCPWDFLHLKICLVFVLLPQQNSN
jgi:hypothetical protein